MENKHITEYEYFILKKNAWIVIKNAYLHNDYKIYIMEKVERVR